MGRLLLMTAMFYKNILSKINVVPTSCGKFIEYACILSVQLGEGIQI